MKHVLLPVTMGMLAGAFGVLAACNAVLGIDNATEEATEGGADAGHAGEAATSDGPEPLTCEQYCSVIMQNCTGADQEYLTQDVCMAMCPVFELGNGITDSLDDTLGCRLWHANAAAAAPDIHCRHAGPLGGDHCGNACEAFCNLDTTYCSGSNLVYDGGFAGCMSACQSTTSYGYLVSDAGDLTLSSGDTLNCRLWHLESAYTSAAAAVVHCPHTALDSGVCHP